jgi:hypothetical protein
MRYGSPIRELTLVDTTERPSTRQISAGLTGDDRALLRFGERNWSPLTRDAVGPSSAPVDATSVAVYLARAC